MYHQEFYGIVLMLIIVLIVVFVAYYQDGSQRSFKNTEDISYTADAGSDFAGKALFMYDKKFSTHKAGSCTETDTVSAVPTGYNPFIRGEIRYSYFQNDQDGRNPQEMKIMKVDHCKNKQVLIEFNCDNYASVSLQSAPILWTEVNCDYGCDEEFGKCNNQMQ